MERTWRIDCADCGEFVKFETETVEEDHSFDSDGKCSKCGYASDVQDSDLKVLVDVDQTRAFVGESLGASATATGGDGQYKFAWKITRDGVELTTTPIVGPRYNYPADEEGIYVFTVIVVDGKGNQTSASGSEIEVIKKEELKISVTADQISAKVGDWISATATATGGNGEYSFAWRVSRDGETIDETDNYISSSVYGLVADAEGTYMFTVSVRDSKGNSQSDDSEQIIVDSAPCNHTPVFVATGNPMYSYYDDTTHIKSVTGYTKCAVCGIVLEEHATDEDYEEHVPDYRDFYHDHPHQLYSHCKYCGQKTLVSHWNTANGKIQSREDCCICHGHVWGAPYDAGNGAWERMCEKCGKTEEAEPLECEEHLWGTEYEDNGQTVKVCERCGLVAVIPKYNAETIIDDNDDGSQQMMRDMFTIRDPVGEYLYDIATINQLGSTKLGKLYYRLGTFDFVGLAKQATPGSDEVNNIVNNCIQNSIQNVLQQRARPKVDTEEAIKVLYEYNMSNLNSYKELISLHDEIKNEAQLAEQAKKLENTLNSISDKYGINSSNLELWAKDLETAIDDNDFVLMDYCDKKIAEISADLRNEKATIDSIKQEIIAVKAPDTFGTAFSKQFWDTKPGTNKPTLGTKVNLALNAVACLVETGFDIYEYQTWSAERRELFYNQLLFAEDNIEILTNIKETFPDKEIVKYCNDTISNIEAYRTSKLWGDVKSYSEEALHDVGLFAKNVVETGTGMVADAAATAALSSTCGLGAFAAPVVLIGKGAGLVTELAWGVGSGYEAFEYMEMLYHDTMKPFYNNYVGVVNDSDTDDTMKVFANIYLSELKCAGLEVTKAALKGKDDTLFIISENQKIIESNMVKMLDVIK